MVLTLPNGEHKTTAQEFSTLEDCQAEVDFLQFVGRARRDAPKEPGETAAHYRCEIGKARFYFLGCDLRSRSCEHIGPLSFETCSAQRWLVRLRDHGFAATLVRCYPHPQLEERWENGWSE